MQQAPERGGDNDYATDAKASVSLMGLRKSFGDVAVINNLNLEIEDGEFVVFVGPSGCGKSTLLRMIAGLEEVTAGEIAIGGRPVTSVPASKRGVAMVFQSYALYPHMTVRENMAFGLKIARAPKQVVRESVDAAAAKLHITELLDRRPGQLSGGQRQRVAIGRAIVREPLMFLFDEPLSNLDAELRVDMRIEIAQLHRELGNTMIYVTHDQTEAMTLADRIVVLRDGTIEQVGTPQEIYEDPDNIFVAGFIGSPRMNILSGTWIGDGTIDLCGFKFKSPVSGEGLVAQDQVMVGIRPEHMSRDDKFDISIPMRIDASEYLGGTRFVYGQTPDGQKMIAEIRSGVDAKLEGTVVVSAEMNYARFFNSAGNRLR